MCASVDVSNVALHTSFPADFPQDFLLQLMPSVQVRTPKDLEKADRLIFPGVGACGQCLEALKAQVPDSSSFSCRDQTPQRVESPPMSYVTSHSCRCCLCLRVVYSARSKPHVAALHRSALCLFASVPAWSAQSLDRSVPGNYCNEEGMHQEDESGIWTPLLTT